MPSKKENEKQYNNEDVSVTCKLPRIINLYAKWDAYAGHPFYVLTNGKNFFHFLNWIDESLGIFHCFYPALYDHLRQGMISMLVVFTILQQCDAFRVTTHMATLHAVNPLLNQGHPTRTTT